MVIKIRTIIGRSRQCPQWHFCSKFTSRSYKKWFSDWWWETVDEDTSIHRTWRNHLTRKFLPWWLAFVLIEGFMQAAAEKEIICEPWKLQSWPAQGMSMGAIVVWTSYLGTNHILNGFKVFPIKRNTSYKSGQEINFWWPRPLPQAAPVRASPLEVYGKHKLTWWIIKKEKKICLKLSKVKVVIWGGREKRERIYNKNKLY